MDGRGLDNRADTAFGGAFDTTALDTTAVVLEAPERIALSRLTLPDRGEGEAVVDMEWSGISTGTEKLLWSGAMPPFPGMGYPLVPGYESVGRVRSADAAGPVRPGDRVFVPGARCYGAVRGLFGGAASRVVVPSDRLIPVPEGLGEEGVLLALAATAYHALEPTDPAIENRLILPELIVGHGVLGRLIARLVVALDGPPPVVWETNPARRDGADGYQVISPDDDDRADYAAIVDVSGDSAILDRLVSRLAPRGEIVLAGFYAAPLSFVFPPAFMKEARLRIAAEFKEPDLRAVTGLIAAGRLSLNGLITHRHGAQDAATAYRTAFDDADCLKMILDWRTCS